MDGFTPPNPREVLDAEARMQREGSIRMEILLVGRNPISGDVVLRCGQVELASADHFVEVFF